MASHANSHFCDPPLEIGKKNNARTIDGVLKILHIAHAEKGRCLLIRYFWKAGSIKKRFRVVPLAKEGWWCYVCAR
jgi:hypothetical protein